MDCSAPVFDWNSKKIPWGKLLLPSTQDATATAAPKEEPGLGATFK